MGAEQSSAAAAEEEVQTGAELPSPDAAAVAATYAKAGRLLDTLDETGSGGDEDDDVHLPAASDPATTEDKGKDKPVIQLPLTEKSIKNSGMTTAGSVDSTLSVASWVSSNGTNSKGQRIKIKGLAASVGHDLNGQEGVVTSVGSGSRKGQLYCKVGRLLIRIHAENALVLSGDSDSLSTYDEAATGRESQRLDEGEVAGATFKAGERIVLVGTSGVKDGTPAVVTGVGTGRRKGQLYVLVGQTSMRVWADCAEMVDSPVEPPSPMKGHSQVSERPSAIEEGYAAGVKFKKGMKVLLLGVSYQGIDDKSEAVVTGVGMGTRKGQLYVQTPKGCVRVWAECARPVDPLDQIGEESAEVVQVL